MQSICKNKNDSKSVKLMNPKAESSYDFIQAVEPNLNYDRIEEVRQEIDLVFRQLANDEIDILAALDRVYQLLSHEYAVQEELFQADISFDINYEVIFMKVNDFDESRISSVFSLLNSILETISVSDDALDMLEAIVKQFYANMDHTTLLHFVYILIENERYSFKDKALLELINSEISHSHGDLEEYCFIVHTILIEKSEEFIRMINIESVFGSFQEILASLDDDSDTIIILNLITQYASLNFANHKLVFSFVNNFFLHTYIDAVIIAETILNIIGLCISHGLDQVLVLDDTYYAMLSFFTQKYISCRRIYDLLLTQSFFVLTSLLRFERQDSDLVMSIICILIDYYEEEEEDDEDDSITENIRKTIKEIKSIIDTNFM